MKNDLLNKYTYFLGMTEEEVEESTFNGHHLLFMGKDELGYGMYERCYQIDSRKIFLLHFDRDAGSVVTVQRTYWDGLAVYKDLQQLSQFRCDYMPNFQTNGFCVRMEKFGKVLFELVPDGNMYCVMSSIIN